MNKYNAQAGELQQVCSTGKAVTRAREKGWDGEAPVPKDWKKEFSLLGHDGISHGNHLIATFNTKLPSRYGSSPRASKESDNPLNSLSSLSLGQAATL